jgi:hypothetical protein
LKVDNPTTRFLSDIEVDVRFDEGSLTVLEEPPELGYLTPPPRPYGKRGPRPTLVEPDWTYGLGAIVPPVARRMRRTWIDGGRLRVRFQVSSLRQLGGDESDLFFILLTRRPESGTLRGTWTVTIREPEAVLTGALEIPICDKAVDITDLLLTFDERK